MKKIKIDVTKAVDTMMRRNKRNVFENQLHTLVDRLKMMEQAQTMVYMMIKLNFDMRQKDLMKTCKTADEVAIKVLEYVLSTIKEDSLTLEQAEKIMRLVKGEERLEDNQ